MISFYFWSFWQSRSCRCYASSRHSPGFSPAASNRQRKDAHQNSVAFIADQHVRRSASLMMPIRKTSSCETRWPFSCSCRAAHASQYCFCTQLSLGEASVAKIAAFALADSHHIHILACRRVNFPCTMTGTLSGTPHAARYPRKQPQVNQSPHGIAKIGIQPVSCHCRQFLDGDRHFVR